ncbi:hypothetical protein B0F90DRAFT_1816101 [Multifurca ochricompacta]|uniref:Uncharacterized protein n=1 Tax=Multifurca ochricompacta TaxID=376703 RepID=A0AAD4M6M9_9AGAM|nr:hypothetical protein B0F90DRAFT_1816101 [Multifurca ochricompacta]
MASVKVGLKAKPTSHPVQGENIIIKRRRKRLLNPWAYLDESYGKALEDTTLPMAALFGSSSSSDNTRAGCSVPRDLFMPERQAGESGAICPVPSQASSRHDGEADRKYGRRNGLATVNINISYSGPMTTSSQSDHCIRTYPRIHSNRLPRRVPHLRRKHFAKSLAQRLFEADVFSNGNTSRPRPKIRKRQQASVKKGNPARMQAISVSPYASPNTSPDPTVVFRKPPSRNGATTHGTRTDGPGTALVSGKAFCARGQKRNLARLPPGPFEYMPLPLVRVRTHQGAVQTQRSVVHPDIGAGMNAAHANSIDVLLHPLAL